MKFLLSFFIGLFLLACAGLSSSKVTLGTMTDPRDGRTYKTVKIGSQNLDGPELELQNGFKLLL